MKSMNHEWGGCVSFPSIPLLSLHSVPSLHSIKVHTVHFTYRYNIKWRYEGNEWVLTKWKRMNLPNERNVSNEHVYASRYRQYINYIELTELNEMNWFNCWVCCKRYEVTERNLMEFDWSESNEWKCSSNVTIPQLSSLRVINWVHGT